MSQAEEIKIRLDVVDLIGESVSLRKTGRTFKALCPFHTERTPSFTVDPERQTWHCFGACSEGGDVFSFRMRQEGVDFLDAVRSLALEFGVTIPESGAGASARRPDLSSATGSPF